MSRQKGSKLIEEHKRKISEAHKDKIVSDRTHWIKFSQSLLSEKYGYQYTQDNEAILNLPQIK